MPAISTPIVLLNFTIIILITIILVVGKPRNRGWYLVSIFVISADLLFLTQLMTPHIVGSGSDIHFEKYVLDLTMAVNRWDSTNPAISVNGILSTTIFPAMVCTILGISSEAYFKFILPAISILVPLLIFINAESLLRNIGAVRDTLNGNRLVFSFLAALVYIFNFSFITGPAGIRVAPAFLGIALAVYALIGKNLPTGSRRLIFILSSVLVFVSHYTTAAFWVLTLAISVILLRLFRRHSTKASTPTFVMNTILLLLTLYLCWYVLLTQSITEALVKVPISIIGDINSLFNPKAYSPEVLETVVGYGLEANLPNLIIKIVGNIIRVFIPAGFLFLLYHLWRAKLRASWELLAYCVFSILSFLIISLSVLPKLTIYYDIQRIYLQSLILLAVFFPLGIYFSGEFLLKLLKNGQRRLQSIVVWVSLSILILQFMCQTNTLDYLFGNSRGMYYIEQAKNFSIILDQDIDAVEWVKEYRSEQPIYVYRWTATFPITSYAGIIADIPPGIDDLQNWTGLAYFHRSFFILGDPNRISKLDAFNQVYDSGLNRVCKTDRVQH